MQTFKQFFESYMLPPPKHQQLCVVFPFDGEIWTKEQTKVFNKLSEVFPQSHYCVTIGVDNNSETAIKRKIIEACGVPNVQIVECSNPFEPFKVIKLYDNETDVVVLLLDDEQIKQIHNKTLFKKYSKSGKHLPYSECIYYVKVPTNRSKYTFNEILIKYNKINDILGRKQFVNKIFGNADFDQIDKLLNLKINS